jgi:hypothetical protein
MRVLWVLLVLAVVGCGVDTPEQPAFAKVDLPAAPVVLSAAGDELLIGVRRDGQPVVPGLLRYKDGTTTEVVVRGVSPYGLLAKWYAVDADGGRVLAVGGERGGAHANVRWSVWTGTTDELTEKPQGFSTFGGWGAGELMGAVLTEAGPAIIGSWESAQAGLDIAVWTAEGDTWKRNSSTGTVLQSSRTSLSFPIAVSGLGQGILIAGMQLTSEPGNNRQLPVVWRSSVGTTGWTSSPLPDAGRTGVAMAARCQGEECAVSGSVDGKLAVWRLTGGAWVRVKGTSSIAVEDRGRLAAPIEIDGKLVQILSDGGKVKIVRADGDQWNVRAMDGPSGTVTAVTKVGNTVYVLAGPDENTQTLWRADVTSLR